MNVALSSFPKSISTARESTRFTRTSVYRKQHYTSPTKTTKAENILACILEALPYKPEGPQLDSRWCYWDFFCWYNPSGRTMALESTQSLTKMSTRNIFCGVKAAVA